MHLPTGYASDIKVAGGPRLVVWRKKAARDIFTNEHNHQVKVQEEMHGARKL